MNSDVVLVFTACRQTWFFADSLSFPFEWHREIKRVPERHRGLSSAMKQKKVKEQGRELERNWVTASSSVDYLFLLCMPSTNPLWLLVCFPAVAVPLLCVHTNTGWTWNLDFRCIIYACILAIWFWSLLRTRGVNLPVCQSPKWHLLKVLFSLTNSQKPNISIHNQFTTCKRFYKSKILTLEKLKPEILSLSYLKIA